MFVGVVVGGVAWLAHEFKELNSRASRRKAGREPSPEQRSPEVPSARFKPPTAPVDLPDGIPGGLNNTGNTCFLNCVLQSLASLPTFRSYVAQTAEEEHRFHCGNGFASLLGIYLQRLAARTETPKTYSPRDVLSRTSAKSLHAHLLVGDLSRIGQQHDAHELFLAVMIVLHKTTGEHLRGWRQEDVSAAQGAAAENEEWPTLGGQTAEMLENPFGCLMQSKARCQQCGTVGTAHNEYCVHVPLQLPCSYVPLTLRSCLEKHFGTEVVRLRCEQCDHRQPGASPALVHEVN